MNNETQNPSQQINQEVRGGRVIYIHWAMRNWKSLLWACIWYHDYYPRIYSNMQIYHNEKSVLTKHMKSFQEFERIRFSYKLWVIVIDEAWINVNWKDGASNMSRLLEKLLFLSWKKNCDIIFIAQRFWSWNINFRWAASENWLILKCKKVSRRNGYPIFLVTREKMKPWGWERPFFHSQWETKPIDYMKANWISYDTLEESSLANEKDDKNAEDYTTKNLVWTENL